MAYQLVVIGTSWGGLNALQVVVAGLPKGFPLAVVAVQHRSKDSDETLVTLLQGCSALPVREVEDKEPIQPGSFYVAPPDYHVLIERRAFALSTEGPVDFSRPSINVLFDSAAEAYRQNLIGVVLTGANRDGATGLERIKQLGGYALVQDPETAESRPMPEGALAQVKVDKVLPLEAIPAYLVELSKIGR